MKDKGLLEENVLQTNVKNYIQMVTYPPPTQYDIDSTIDEQLLGILPKKREYTSSELQAKKEENLNQIYLYYSDLESKIGTAEDDKLQILRINMANAIFLHDKMRDYYTGDPNFSQEVLGLNLYWLIRVRITAIKEQIKRGLVDSNGNLISGAQHRNQYKPTTRKPNSEREIH